ncbi:deleted in malignant brain tumors 1 protein-like [Pomacea canaliculata]|uniref:deleted in malignant brain tumors 1 protein-like n=1 Tax=Pomacea canaliculata TaxID=400727 RepID=UPI000D73C039|nr:deleted in malignant brain tumors 1 protein-like [Pomacea canaliculata]
MKSSVHIACLMLALLLPGIDGQRARLVKGTSRYNGRLELFYNGTWNTVCNDLFDAKEAKVACRMLGFNSSRALAVRTSMYGEDSAPILLDNVRCRGSEATLMQCQHNGLYNNDCGHQEDLGVICSNQPEELRLTGTRPDIPGLGRVEINLAGEWYTMCIPEVNVSEVVCRQLGLPFKSAVPLRKFSLGPLNKPKLLTSLKCKGHEGSVIECDQASYNNPLEIFFSCNSESDYYGVSCGISPLTFIQLNEGPYPAMEGTNITLECITEHALTNYTWQNNAGGLANESSLVINNLNRTHNGKRIQCLAVSRDGLIVSSNTLSLQVYYKPVIRIYSASSNPYWSSHNTMRSQEVKMSHFPVKLKATLLLLPSRGQEE